MEKFLTANGWVSKTIKAPNGRKQLMWKPKNQSERGVEYNTLTAYRTEKKKNNEE